MSFVIGIIAYTIAIVSVTYVVAKEIGFKKAYDLGYEQGSLDGVFALGKTLEDGMTNDEA